MDKYVIHVEDTEFKIDKDSVDRMDIVRLSNFNFHLLKNNDAFAIKLRHADYDRKSMVIEVNGNTYTVRIDDGYDQMVDKMGLLVGSSQQAKDIKSPMPGLIVDVMVEAGQKVTEGTALVILSAMKMENILVAQADGIIKSVHVEKDDTVDKGQIIIEME